MGEKLTEKFLKQNSTSRNFKINIQQLSYINITVIHKTCEGKNENIEYTLVAVRKIIWKKIPNPH